ncbi:MAG: MalY/PatB family protein [Pseudomonadota bacterium]
MAFDFDTAIERRGTNCVKWDGMERIYGVDPGDGLAMWVADMDFRAPPVVLDALQNMVDHGVFGYGDGDAEYRRAICDWMRDRHGWADVDPQSIFTTNGLVNAISLCLDTYTAPGDGIVLFTPVYHAFARSILRAGRKVVECELANVDGRYQLDIDAWDAQMTGSETMAILCSPHNPGGRVWTGDELRAFADFAARHGLTLISDEIHQDLVYPGATHIPMPVAAPEAVDRTIVLNAPSKTFNIAGVHVGQVIISDPDLRKPFANRMSTLSLSAGTVGLEMTRAAYTPEGVAWLGELIAYLDTNRREFDDGVNAIPGLKSMALESTYLAWVDFTDTGMTPDEFKARVQGEACIAANHGETFGKGGDNFLRFNLATPRANVAAAVERLKGAFADLQ